MVDPVVKLAGRFGVPCLIDVKGDIPVAKRLAVSFPGTHLIYPHMGPLRFEGSEAHRCLYRPCRRHENVRLDLSGVELDAKIGEAVQRIGPGKLIWGTDGPYAIPPWWIMPKTG